MGAFLELMMHLPGLILKLFQKRVYMKNVIIIIASRDRRLSGVHRSSWNSKSDPDDRQNTILRLKIKGDHMLLSMKLYQY